MTKFLKLCVLAGGVSAMSLTSAFAGEPKTEAAQVVVAAQTQLATVTQFDKFVPQAQTKRTRIDYDVFNDALENVVVDFGDSLRFRALRPNTELGTRFNRGHTSPYRLEGSRVTFSQLTDAYKVELSAYRRDLERVGTQIDLTRLSRNEQLAYWLNLHNATLIEQVALQYPVRRPGRMKVKVGDKKVPVHDAKILNVKGVPLSLRDIRENIVAKNWSDPKVIYGFFMSNVGSPRLNGYAFNGENVNYVLKINADEFVNSLRGFNTSKSYRNVSKVYEDFAPFYFKDFDTDIIRHLKSYANEAVTKELLEDKPVRIEPLEEVLADLTGGNGVTTLSNSGGPLVSEEMQRLLREADNKFRIQQRKGLIKPRGGVVIIEDIVTDSDTIAAQQNGSVVPAPPAIVTQDDPNN